MRAVIRDEALRLFAAHGPGAVTVRQIATAAGVSPALVIHHFGSKERLRDVVDQHVLATFEAMFTALTADGHDPFGPAAAGSLTELMAAHLPPESSIPGYLRHLLLTDSDASRALFRRLFDFSHTALTALAREGLAAPGEDPRARAVVLLVHDLAVLLLRDRMADVLGADPLSPEGMARWAGEALAIYRTGLLTAPPPAAGHSPGEGGNP